MTNAAVRLFRFFSFGELKLFEDQEIEKDMRSDLSWNAAKIYVESEIGRTYKGNPTEFTHIKAKYLTDSKIKKTLTSNWKIFRKEWPLFEKLPNFAIFRLRVHLFVVFCISIKTNYFTYLLFRNTACGIKLIRRILRVLFSKSRTKK